MREKVMVANATALGGRGTDGGHEPQGLQGAVAPPTTSGRSPQTEGTKDQGERRLRAAPDQRGPDGSDKETRETRPDRTEVFTGRPARRGPAADGPRTAGKTRPGRRRGGLLATWGQCAHVRVSVRVSVCVETEVKCPQA